MAEKTMDDFGMTEEELSINITAAVGGFVVESLGVRYFEKEFHRK